MNPIPEDILPFWQAFQATRVDLVPFSEVTAEFAAVEGEEDRSLEYRQDVHTASFERECARLGRTPGPEMVVVCELFEMIYRP